MGFAGRSFEIGSIWGFGAKSSSLFDRKTRLASLLLFPPPEYLCGQQGAYGFNRTAGEAG